MPEFEKSRFLNTCPECGEVIDVSQCGPLEKVVCPACDRAIRVRTTFDHFVIEGNLGEGGMSRVFRAKDTKLGRAVALKILHPEFTADVELTKRFEREAQLTASMSHPNVVKVYSVGRDQEYFYIAMELVEGKSLEELIREEERIEEKRALDLAIQVAQGLRAAQQSGLIHRDIKPGNILITRGEVAKIVDFGLALVAERDVDESSVIWATPYYVPPEKLHDRPEDLRGDIYSLGATLFHALAGRPPFDANTISLEELKALKDKRVSLKGAEAEVSAETCQVIDRMLERKPEDRFEDYDELLEELSKVRTVIRAPSLQEARTPEPYSQRTLAVAAAAFFLIALAIVYQAVVKNRLVGGDVSGVLPMESFLEPKGGGGGATAAAKFIEARGKLLKGEVPGASKLFNQLIQEEGLSHPTLQWAIYNGGICALMRGDAAASRKQFEELGKSAKGAGEGAESEEIAMTEFFSDVSRNMQRELPVMPSELKEEKSQTIYSMAWLAYGLKNWQDGEFEEAMEFFSAFERATAPKRLEWINSYKGLLESFKADVELIRRAPKPRSAMDLEEVEAVLAALTKLEKKLKTKGSGVDLIKDRQKRANAHREQLKLAAKKKEMKQVEAAVVEAGRVKDEEVKAAKELIGSLTPYGLSYEFLEAVERLEEAKFTVAEAKRMIGDEMRIWKAAGRFSETLIGDLNRVGYRGEIRRAEATPLEGTITRVSGGEVRVQLEFGETRIPFDAISGEGRLLIATKLLDAAPTAEEKRGRREMIVFYARQTGMDVFAANAAAVLAKEDGEFAEFWKGIEGETGEENGVKEDEGKLNGG